MLETLLQNLQIPLSLPAWVVDETHRRIVLLLNHVLMQEPSARQRLTVQNGRVVLLQWRAIQFKVRITLAGLLDLAEQDMQPDLTLTLTDESPLALVQGMMRDYKPAVRMDGNAELAGELAWLVGHVEWDIEEDLTRILGDSTAHLLALNGRKVLAMLSQSRGERSAGSSSTGLAP